MTDVISFFGLALLFGVVYICYWFYEPEDEFLLLRGQLKSRCEVCGNDLRWSPKHRSREGNVVIVCSYCGESHVHEKRTLRLC
jgi:hypothetical protein